MGYDKQVGELPSSFLSLVHSELSYPNILQIHFYFCFTCINLLLACPYVHHTHARYLWRPEDGFRSSKLETQTCLTMWVLWKGPLKKQPVLLTDGSSIQLCLQTLVINVLKCSLYVSVLSSCKQDLKYRDPYSLHFTIQACPVQYWNIQQTLNIYSTMESFHFRIKKTLAFIWSHLFTV